MSILTDKLIVFLFCLVLYVQNSPGSNAVVPVLAALTCSALNSSWNRDYLRLAVFSGYTVAAIYYPALLFFIPLMAYDIPRSKMQFILLLVVLPLAVNFSRISSATFLSLVLFIVLARLMNYRAVSWEQMKQQYIELRDSAKEFALQLQEKNRELLERQDYQINLATLEERNRIAREIHDSVGHLLSSSILQTGALMAGCRDEALKESLNTLKTTLSQGMDSIRASIHDLHDQSLDLYSEACKLIDNFNFCPVVLDYDIEAKPDKKINFAFIAIIKEALANIMKHSNARRVRITLREHPGFYQLVVEDNGSRKSLNPGGGIGLKNISDRVDSLGGNINISSDKGFVLFISVPREGSYEYYHRG